MAIRRYRVVNDPDWEVWVEGEPGHWAIRCPCHLGPDRYYFRKDYAIRAARLHRRRGRQASPTSSAGGGR